MWLRKQRVLDSGMTGVQQALPNIAESGSYSGGRPDEATPAVAVSPGPVPDGTAGAAAVDPESQDVSGGSAGQISGGSGASGASAAVTRTSSASVGALMETWLVLEYCDRGSLHEALEARRFVRKADGSLDLLGMYRSLIDIASGMDYLHSMGVLHGDLKTANVLLKSTATDPRGAACKLADFGLSRMLEMDKSHISTQTYGTVAYMPAELLNNGRMTKAVDVYSFGMLMWELFTGSPPYSGLTVGQILVAVVYQNQRPPVPDDCPEAYRAIMEACWHADPTQRPTFDTISKNLQKAYALLRHDSKRDKIGGDSGRSADSQP
jgi:serine/threonine protein kinase